MAFVYIADGKVLSQYAAETKQMKKLWAELKKIDKMISMKPVYRRIDANL